VRALQTSEVQIIQPDWDDLSEIVTFLPSPLSRLAESSWLS
jgi:hypothetical protein